MRKLWCVIGMMGLALSACTTQQETQPSAPAQPAYTGPVVEISGAEPRYEPYNPGNMQDYEVNGKRYSIVKNPLNFSQTGLAAWYDSESSGNSRTASGKPFDAYALAAAHSTLPLPSYVRVTNLSNGRQLVVRVNDRGPYTPGRIIDLTRAAYWQKNLSNRFSVPGRVSANGNLFRVQLGPFQSRQQAQALVQRLQSEAQQQAFITAQ